MAIKQPPKTRTVRSWREHQQATPEGRRWRMQTRHRWKLRRVVSLAVFVIVLGLLGVGVGGAVFFWYFSRGLPEPGQLIERSIPQSTKIYDRTGKNLLFDVHGDIKRTAVKLADISPYIKSAAIVAEDKNFYKHGGFDLRGIFRAVLINALRGGKLQGGSTITQQFIKNAVLSPEKTYTRKFKELVMAYKIEKKFSKDQILEMYFNEIPYGSTSYGVEAAAQTFFDKKAHELDLAEAALLAALPKAPTYYSPYGSHKDELVGRQKYILDEMVKEGYASEGEAKKAKDIKILEKIKPKRENLVAPHFVMYVRELLAEKYGDRAVEQGGLKIITTLDLEKQRLAEKAINDNKKLVNSFGASNAALVSLDIKTGQIISMVGSLDYFDEKIDGNVNVVLRPRQPGSSFKPIVYAASFIKGFTPETVLYDVNTIFKTEIGKDYEPKNYDGKEHGVVTVRQALAGSLNVPAVKMIYLTGVSNVLDLAEKMGYSTLKDRSRFGLSLVLGGGEVRPLEHANAFSVFAREGKYLPEVAILSVEDANGKLLEEWKEESPKEVFDPQIAKQISSVLSDNSARTFIFGEQNYLTLPDRPVAAKTGTTNDFRDAWTIGYTPSVVTGVWVGNNNNSAMKEAADGSRIAAPIWNQYMRTALAGSPAENFSEPEPVITGKPILDGQADPGITIKIDRVSGKIATEYTPLQAIIERKYRQTHDTLFYINKDDPRGPTPANPAEDIQFENWETAVKRWASEQGYVDETPPTEYDDVHLPGDKPTIKINVPANNATIKSTEFDLSVEASARRSIKKFEVYIDNELIGTTSSSQLNQRIGVSVNISNGFHNLRVIVFDDLENSASAEATINLLR